MKICFHYLLHIADSIQNTGPCWATWQYPMERVCGMLQPLAKSRLHPYKNLTNNVYLLELYLVKNMKSTWFIRMKIMEENSNGLLSHTLSTFQKLKK
jgi:hypothetical protein